jgi:transposase
LTEELAARGIKKHVWAVWTFVHAEELSFKKTIEPAEQDRPDSPVSGYAGGTPRQD